MRRRTKSRICRGLHGSGMPGFGSGKARAWWISRFLFRRVEVQGMWVLDLGGPARAGVWGRQGLALRES